MVTTVRWKAKHNQNNREEFLARVANNYDKNKMEQLEVLNKVLKKTVEDKQRPIQEQSMSNLNFVGGWEVLQRNLTDKHLKEIMLNLGLVRVRKVLNEVEGLLV